MVLRRMTRRRLERLKHWEDFQSVGTSTPLDEPEEVARQLAVRSVRAHFTNTRKLLVPALLALVASVAILPFLGDVPATVLSVVVGAVTVVLGIAARPVVENFIAGLVVGFSKVLNIGDTVMVDGNYCTVEDISATHTTLKLWDWRRYVVPNTQMLQTEFINYTLTDSFVWAYVEFWVSYEADLKQIRELCEAIPEKSRYYSEYEAPRFWVMDTDKEGIRCWLAAWANSPADAWMLKTDIRTELVLTLRELGIRTHCYELAVHEGPRPHPERSSS